MTGDNAIETVTLSGAGSLKILQALQIERLVLEVQITHRCIVDGRRHTAEFGQHVVGGRSDHPLDDVLVCQHGGLVEQAIDLITVDLGDDLPTAGVMAGVDEAVPLGEVPYVSMIFWSGDPDRVAVQLVGAADDLVHHGRAVTPAAMAGSRSGSSRALAALRSLTEVETRFESSGSTRMNGIHPGCRTTTTPDHSFSCASFWAMVSCMAGAILLLRCRSEAL